MGEHQTLHLAEDLVNGCKICCRSQEETVSFISRRRSTKGKGIWMARMLHLTYAGGRLIVPAVTPYDREQMVEHVLNTVRAKRAVEVKLAGRAWKATLADARRMANCLRCGGPIDSVVCKSLHNSQRTALCVNCALGRA